MKNQGRRQGGAYATVAATFDGSRHDGGIRLFFSTWRPPPLPRPLLIRPIFFFCPAFSSNYPTPAILVLWAVNELSRRQTITVTLPYPYESANYTSGSQNLLIFFTPKWRFSHNHRIIKRILPHIFEHFFRRLSHLGRAYTFESGADLWGAMRSADPHSTFVDGISLVG